ncbi:hypothetical protein HYFRA_00002298 [Hymenoscyphus fraxineus]|uniref:Tubulin-specific chaperone D C-terminal domain-containing protein n=1 Tax=Hymenoscyphus fraxineus TaxID=746836 RepID=A0A9N9L621_9HELO|nr:hypothetical protein HYFRA_00002298 [Hymenoscyphus fraxineus]
MDAPDEDKDVVLQRSSEEIIATLKTSVNSFLRKSEKKVRRHVRVRETQGILNLLEHFQELPQLLDPHLQSLVPLLADAFLEHLVREQSSESKPTEKVPNDSDHLLQPLSQAICQLLYTFCKIRGGKVIVRFLSTETRFLELLLSAIEAGNVEADDDIPKGHTWRWEERYITLLWLSQLLLAPFDLSTISSTVPVNGTSSTIPGLEWPENVPGVSVRVISLAIKHLSSAGKESDAAKVLLVRVAMRRDMQQLGILNCLARWAISMFRAPEMEVRPAQHYIGLLSFLAGLLVSSVGTSDMHQHLEGIFVLAQAIVDSETPLFKIINDSAVARKNAIKMIRTIGILDLRNIANYASQARIEGTIGHLLGFLADRSTPVRLADSKALSMVTLKLDEDMASEVVDAVINDLTANGNPWHGVIPNDDLKVFNLSSADEMHWHGLILTLSHLLYRHAIPATKLGPILSYLIVGLSFEKRNTSGVSVGTSVRDAACFGIWALARRYTTAELRSVALDTSETPSLSATFTVPLETLKEHSQDLVVQGLAVELVISACLDPAGNIRRGSSAALQELVGRHPDTIIEGITLVQVIDYHAIARRSRALQEVAPPAARLSRIYSDALVAGLAGWRGVGDSDASMRRMSANAFSEISWADQNSSCSLLPNVEITDSLMRLFNRYNDLPVREASERHGLLLCIAGITEGLRPILGISNIKRNLEQNSLRPLQKVLCSVISMYIPVLIDAELNLDKKGAADLSGEGISRVLLSMIPLLRAELVLRGFLDSSISQSPRRSEKEQASMLCQLDIPLWHGGAGSIVPTEALTSCQNSYDSGFPPMKAVTESARRLLLQFAKLKEKESIQSVTEALSNYILLFEKTERATVVMELIEAVIADGNSGRTGQGKASLKSLFVILPLVADSSLNPKGLQEKIFSTLHWRWTLVNDIETRVTILECLAHSSALLTHTTKFTSMIREGLDDYTTDNRGDVGSHVRIAALRVVEVFGRNLEPSDKRGYAMFHTFVGRILRLASEKLDKVRIEAQKALTWATSNEPNHRGAFVNLSSNSHEYYAALLAFPDYYYLDGLIYQVQWLTQVLEGYVLSADTGSQDVVRASRDALVEYCDAKDIHATLISCALLDLLTTSINDKNERIIPSVLEVIAFLLDMGIVQRSKVSFPELFKLVQRSHFQTRNVKKLEAAVKVYGGMIPIHNGVLKKLTSMLLHPFPRVRNLVAEELWVQMGVGKGVNWTKATQTDMAVLRKELGVV